MGEFGDGTEQGNNLINPGLDTAENDTSAYTYTPIVGQGHNGAGGGESY